jgi:2-polyprenyl-3-methyl-5-hydroxy-6-metoxy-1,4-benzoquinol methylase
MRSRLRRLAAVTYRMVSRAPLPEEQVEVEPGTAFAGYQVHYGDAGAREAETFFQRMPDWLDLRAKSVLDVGCALGILCLEAARRGARRVLGVETGQPGIEYARWRLRREDGSLPVEFRLYAGDPDELGDERFDVVLCKDSFERFRLRPPVGDFETMAERMADRLHPDSNACSRPAQTGSCGASTRQGRLRWAAVDGARRLARMRRTALTRRAGERR